jgi:hypothetical protein
MAKAFRPWLIDLKLAVVFTALAALATGLFSFSVDQDQAQGQVAGQAVARWKSYFLSCSLVFGAGILIFMNRFLRRFNGQVVEARALNDLERRLGANWELTRNVSLPSGGDLDGLLRGPDGLAFALEIKSKVSVKIVKGLLGMRDVLVDHEGVAVNSAMLKQAIKNAHQVGAVPVLWFPRAKQQSYAKNIQGVVVVCGSASYLMRALGVKGRSWW